MTSKPFKEEHLARMKNINLIFPIAAVLLTFADTVDAFLGLGLFFIMLSSFLLSIGGIIQDGKSNDKEAMRKAIYTYPKINFIATGIISIILIAFKIYIDYILLFIFGILIMITGSLLYSSIGIVFTLNYGNFQISKERKNLINLKGKGLIYFLVLVASTALPSLILGYLNFATVSANNTIEPLEILLPTLICSVYLVLLYIIYIDPLRWAKNTKEKGIKD